MSAPLFSQIIAEVGQTFRACPSTSAKAVVTKKASSQLAAWVPQGPSEFKGSDGNVHKSGPSNTLFLSPDLFKQ